MPGWATTRSLLLVTALVESGAALALLIAPSWTVEVLLGTGLTSPQSLILGRVTGFALGALAVASWLAWLKGGSGSHTELVAGLLLYNLGVPLLLVSAALAASMRGIALWPASVLHVLLAIWCIASLRLR